MIETLLFVAFILAILFVALMSPKPSGHDPKPSGKEPSAKAPEPSGKGPDTPGQEKKDADSPGE